MIPRALPLLAMLIPATASSAEIGLSIPAPTKTVFDNGLRVLVMEDPSTPVATVQIWYHVGSKNEVPGKRGLAHLFEHLMFRGTEKYGPGVFDDRLDAIGGVNNAFTSEDVTAYHESVPAEAIDVALELEADRMRHLKLVQATVDSEREVVKEEKRLRLDNDPLGKTFEVFRSVAYTTHPYSWTPAGMLDDLASVTVPEAQAFYDRWYQPNNAVLVVVGDVKTADVLAKAHRHFDAIPRGAEPSRAIAPEPPQRETRTKTLELDTQLPILIGGYHVPGLASADMAPLEVLGVILSAGESSRLYRSLVKTKKLAVFAQGATESFEDPGLFVVIAGFLPPTKPAQIERALLAEVERVAATGVTARELEKARNQLLAGHVFGLGTVEGKGMSLGSAETLEGDYRKFLDETTKYEHVTVAQVQDVARRYLVKKNLTTITLLPKEAP